MAFFLRFTRNVKRMKAVKKKADKFYEHVLDEHERHAKRKSFNEHGTKDMVDVLLQLADDPTLEVKVERDHIKAAIQVIKFCLQMLNFKKNFSKSNLK